MYLFLFIVFCYSENRIRKHPETIKAVRNRSAHSCPHIIPGPHNSRLSSREIDNGRPIIYDAVGGEKFNTTW